MPDYFGLPDTSDRQQLFHYVGGTAYNANSTVRYQTWLKPRGVGMVHILSIDPGSGGGGGFSGATSTQRGGGGSGTAGVIVSLLVPAAFLPDLLYVFVAPGAAGGAAGQAGGNPNFNAIVAASGYAANNYVTVLQSNSGGPGGGGAGTATTGGTADGVETTVPQSHSFLTAGIGMFSAVATSGGNAGGASGAGTDCQASKMTCCVMPGAGGGGCTSGNVDSAGGGFIGSANVPWLVTTIPGGAVGGGRGSDGFALTNPMMFYGGCGGGSNSAGTGGAGGNGAIGCGGGGGGGGITGGAGGNGGNGLVIITCW